MRKTVIVDIDGTICDISKRVVHLEQKTPKDWKSFKQDYHLDKPIKPIIDLVRNLSVFYDIIFCTGRSEDEREVTMAFIWDYYDADYNFTGHNIIMRKEGDRRHDYIVKPENLKKFGYNTTNVAFILEDRDSVVKEWRKLGFTCLQVAEGKF
jgi:hypothetical protein